MSTSVTDVTGAVSGRITLCAVPGVRLRERQRSETRLSILEAALRLFEAKGYEHTTVEDIANAVGISSRTFFRYFESKTALLFDGQNDDKHDKHDHSDLVIDALIARPATETITEALAAVLREQLGTMFDEHGLKLRQLGIILADPALRLLAQDGFHEHRPDLERGFAARLGVQPDDLVPRVLAAAFTEAIWIILERWVASGAEGSQLPGLIDEAFAAITNGLG
ncbi:MAG: Transcriptional regulator, TetR family protein [Ilumatobacteraceae bacterium]|nr:Transcriptional regulator, TetR family protein [Ilumatobacteraceae bacterium]